MPIVERFIINSDIVMLAILILLLSPLTDGLRWRNEIHEKGRPSDQPSLASSMNGPTTSDVYATALTELQELESEPLCHRVAARLLVGNCQLLNGQNEASVLTDTGRAARDFVDFFAASLAICDLERANFEIPSSCYKFRENVLASLPAPSKPELHVATVEIDQCLEGLAKTDSAWSTWVSYRHKALRFCEAARSESEKDQHILLHQKLAFILKRLTSQAEHEIQDRVNNLERVFQKSTEDAKNLRANVENFEMMTSRLSNILGNVLSDSVKTQTAVYSGMEGAESIVKYMDALLSQVKLREEQMAHGYEVALSTATTIATQDLAEMAQAVDSIAAAFKNLQMQLANSENRVSSVVQQQAAIQKTMENLQGMADLVLEKQKLQSKTLGSTHNQTLSILSSLEVATMSVRSLQKPLFKLGKGIWWPYIICPVATLTLGSYGLQPSAARNLFLLSAGEFAGFVVSLASTHQSHEVVKKYFADLLSTSFGSLNHATTDDDASTTYINTTLPGSDFDI